MPSSEDLLLVRLAIANRFVAQEEVDECMEEAESSGVSVTDRLLKRGFLRPDQVEMLRKIQGRPAAPAASGPPPPAPPRRGGDEGTNVRKPPSAAPKPTDLDGDFLRVVRARKLVPEDLLQEARGLAGSLPGSFQRPRVAEALVRRAFLTSFQADEIVLSLTSGGTRCEGCGSPAEKPPAAGSRCRVCDLALPLPGVPIDAEAGTGSPAVGSVAIVCGVNRGNLYVLRRGATLTIGRKSANKIRLFDPASSRDHCKVVEEGGTGTLHDLGSRAGTMVNGTLVKTQRLKGGDLVQIGSTVLEFRIEHSGETRQLGQPAAPAPARELPAAIREEDIDDLLFGAIAVKIALVSRAALEQALAAQEGGEKRQIGKILLEQGALTEMGLVKVLQIQKRNLQRHGAYSKESRESLLFGKVAIRLELIREAALNEALRIQARTRETTGLHLRLGEVLLRRGNLTREGITQVLRVQGKSGGGPQIPGYELEEKLGEGGMGAVFRARQLSLDRIVALKILAPRLLVETGYVERFIREARVAGKMNHPNVVRAIDVGRSGDLCYFVMEFVNGETSGEKVRRAGKLAEREAIAIAIEVARGLSHAAEHGLVHRDVKPDNIMLGADGSVKLLDLGLARGVDREASVTQSGAGEVVGTPNYVSPEQARGLEGVDIRSDLYSLGATLYHLTTGEIPFRGEGAPVVIMARHITEQLPSPRDFAPELSEGFLLVLAHLMVKDRRRRYQAPEELIEDLETLRGGQLPRRAQKSAGRSTIRRR
ncbi:MAG: serine/threonine-protein kinase [Planctomycetales bacterium]|nr:serine/threonine-protein kinase [Planctomycetales bacterium]